MSQNLYPLEQLREIKQKRLEEAEKVLKERKEVLEKEKKKFETVEKERNEVKAHRDDKLQQLRDALDEGLSTAKIQQMRVYMKEVDEKLKVKEMKFKEQKKLFDAAEKNVEEAREQMVKRQHDVEKMRLHKLEWEKEMKGIIEQKEALELDETGSSMYIRKKRAH